MPKRVSTDVDMNILADAAMLKLSNVELAKKYGLSPSYISKLRTGKKPLDMHIPVLIKSEDEGIETFDADIEAITEHMEGRKVITDPTAIETYLKKEITKAVATAKIYMELLKKYKGEN